MAVDVSSDEAETLQRNRRTRRGLLVALAVDNVGSGAFLPLVLLYSTEVLGLSVSLAGAVLFAGTLVGLLAPVVVGGIVDRFGPRRVVITSQLLQAAGMVTYLVAGAVEASPTVAVALATGAAVLVAAGTQTFYSAVFSLIAAVAGAGPKDGAFARVDMVRSAAFGLGSLVAAGLLLGTLDTALRVAVAGDAATFLVAAVLLWRLVHDPERVAPEPVDDARLEAAGGPAPRPWRDRPFLVLLVVIALTGLAVDVFLIGFSVWALGDLQVPAWVPGACVALLTAITSTAATSVVRLTRTWSRLRTVAVGSVVTVAWCAACAATPAVGSGWRPAWLLGATALLAVAAMLITTRVMAMAEASSPAAAHGRYLATVQYAFNSAQLLAPLVVGLFAVALWSPWVVVAAANLAALALLPWLRRHLPPQALAAQG